MGVNRRAFLKSIGTLAATVTPGNAVISQALPVQQSGQSESYAATKYQPIGSGPSQAEGIAKFASRVRYDRL